MELLAKLGIDWQLLIAQLINFGILLAGLTFLVYRPVLRVIDERRERVRKSMEDAKRIENQKKELDEFRVEQMRKIDQEVGLFLETAKTQAEAAKKEILASAEKEAVHLLAKAKQQISEERARMMHEVQDTLLSAIISMTEKILEREFSDADQKRLLASVEKNLHSLIR